MFRLWVVASIFWIIYSAWNSDLSCPLEIIGISTRASPWCEFQNADPLKYYSGLVAKMVMPPALVAVAILSFQWVYRGFRDQRN